jgi:hypothetical protein
VSEPFFLQNRAFSGRKGGETAYMLQNVMEAQRIPSKRRAVVMTEKHHQDRISLFTPEEYDKLCEWNSAPPSREALAKLALGRRTDEQNRATWEMHKKLRKDRISKITGYYWSSPSNDSYDPR